MDTISEERLGRLVIRSKDTNARVADLRKWVRDMGVDLVKGQPAKMRGVIVDEETPDKEKSFIDALLDQSINVKDDRFTWGRGQSVGVADFAALADNLKELQKAIDEKRAIDERLRQAGFGEFVIEDKWHV